MLVREPCFLKAYVCPQVWDVFERGHLFTRQDLELDTYQSRVHLAEIVALLCQTSQQLFDQRSLSFKFFSVEGQFMTNFSRYNIVANVPMPVREILWRDVFTTFNVTRRIRDSPRRTR